MSVVRALWRLQVPAGRRWLLPFTVARLGATAVAGVLVASTDVHPHDIAMLAYGVLSTIALARSAVLRRSPAVWALDFALGLSFVLASDDWRSPYYLLWLTSLALPATTIPLKHGIALAMFAPLAFLAVAVAGGPVPGRLDVRSSETLAIHLSLPLLLGLALAYTAEAVRQLQAERTERERIAIETERRRIAWELHDSAKQRLHAAHLLVSSLQGRLPAELAPVATRASIELESAASDMDTSLAELRSPLEGRPLDEALRERARELADGGGAAVAVEGRAPALPPLVAAHVYRIAAEALTNALRHADASQVHVSLGTSEGLLRLSVRDDGRGLPQTIRPGATGLLAMESRAASIGARVRVADCEPPPGTVVELEVPLT